jgi:hypothetical protein
VMTTACWFAWVVFSFAATLLAMEVFARLK